MPKMDPFLLENMDLNSEDDSQPVAKIKTENNFVSDSIVWIKTERIADGDPLTDVSADEGLQNMPEIPPSVLTERDPAITLRSVPIKTESSISRDAGANSRLNSFLKTAKISLFPVVVLEDILLKGNHSSICKTFSSNFVETDEKEIKTLLNVKMEADPLAIPTPYELINDSLIIKNEIFAESNDDIINRSSSQDTVQSFPRRMSYDVPSESSERKSNSFSKPNTDDVFVKKNITLWKNVKSKGRPTTHATMQQTQGSKFSERCESEMEKVSQYEKDQPNHSVERPFACKQCSAHFKFKSALKTHARSHSDERPFACKQCSAHFKFKSALKTHLQSHSDEKPFSCEKCPVRSKSKSGLKKHLLTHSNEKPFSCKQCPARFIRSTLLTQHLRSHSDFRPFTCALCSAQFKSKADLAKHFTRHSNEKPFCCQQCSKRFKIKKSLEMHYLIHSNTKPYMCDSCSLKFRTKQSLKHHLLSHSGDLSCVYDKIKKEASNTV